jgi:CRP-like cAMP-binding protein
VDLTKFISGDDEVVAYSAGDVIFSVGDIGDDMLVVMEGQVDVRRDGTTVRRVESGGVIGEMALIDQSPRSADAVAAVDCRIAHVDERRFLFLIQETPNFALHIMSVMAERLRA